MYVILVVVFLLVLITSPRYLQPVRRNMWTGYSLLSRISEG